MSTFAIGMVVVAVVAAPVAWAQPLEFESIDPTFTKKALSRPETAQPPGTKRLRPKRPVYTYEDGDRTVRVRLQSDLEVSGDSSVARGSGEHIVTKDSSRRSTGQPVFRSESSGTLMTLPGGVLLVLDAEWSTAETNAFFARNRIKLSRVSDLDVAANSFFVETEPGFASLNLANTLAAQDGVLISSPNWWREHTTK